jgi:hypothetical protein
MNPKLKTMNKILIVVVVVVCLSASCVSKSNIFNHGVAQKAVISGNHFMFNEGKGHAARLFVITPKSFTGLGEVGFLSSDKKVVVRITQENRRIVWDKGKLWERWHLHQSKA